MFQGRDMPLHVPADPAISRFLRDAETALDAALVGVSFGDCTGRTAALLTAEGLEEVTPLSDCGALLDYCAYVRSRDSLIAVTCQALFPWAQPCGLMRARGLQAYLGVPLRCPGEGTAPGGVLFAASDLPRLWRGADIDRMDMLALRAGLLLQRETV